MSSKRNGTEDRGVGGSGKRSGRLSNPGRGLTINNGGEYGKHKTMSANWRRRRRLRLKEGRGMV